MDRSVEFYRESCHPKKFQTRSGGTEQEHCRGSSARVCELCRCGSVMSSLSLTEYLGPQGRPIPSNGAATTLSARRACRAVAQSQSSPRVHGTTDSQLQTKPLGEFRASTSTIPQGIFRDDLVPSGQGDPRWQTNNDKRFGIDHTTIVIADTKEGCDSLQFNRTESCRRKLNHGTEQEQRPSCVQVPSKELQTI